jgi:multicomponent Na+:H+ antiporter subunit D
MNIPAFVWIILIPLLSLPLIYLSGHLRLRAGKRSPAQLVALLALLVCWLPFAQAARQVEETGQISYTLGTISLCFDGISLLLSAVTLGLGTLVVLFSGSYLSAELGQEKYYAMLVAMIGVMIGLGCACDLFNLWIWFEAMAISSYLLVAFYHQQELSLEAGFKYVMQSALGSVLVLLGIGLVLAETGTTSLDQIKAAALPNPLLLAAGGLFVAGFGVKAALVPLHTWLPDAHSQAPSGISAMLSGVVIEAGLIAMLRSLEGLAGVTHIWGPLLLGLGALNMLVGNLMAFRQVQVKRLLAYSSLAHVGYMLLGLGITIYAGNADAAQGSMFHLLNHGLMKGLAFLAAGSLLYALTLSAGAHSPLLIADLSGAGRRYPLVGLALSLALLGLAGLPPLAGFMSKWQIFISGFETHDVWIIALVIFAALNSVFSLAYYTPLINTIYRRKLSAPVQFGAPVPATMTLPLAGLALLILLVGMWPALTYWLTSPAGSALLAAFGN